MDLIQLEAVQLFGIVLSALSIGILIGYYSRRPSQTKENS